MNPKLIEDMSWRMAEVYGAVTDRILINLARHFKLIAAGSKPGGSWDYQVKKLAELGQVSRETEAIILNTIGDADGVLQELLEESIREGLKGVEEPLKQAAEKGLLFGQGMLPPEVSPGQTQAFKAFYQQSADKLNLVNTVMLESTERAYQDTVAYIGAKIGVTQGILNTATGEVVSGVSSLNQAIRDGVKRMVDNGLTGFIDHGGHHWSPEAYVAMDVKTTMFNTARAAVWERQEEYGNDLYQVSHHDGARPLCYPWQGKVISRDDLSREVEDDEGNTVHVYAQSETSYGQAAGLFGINCKHYPIPFIPGFSRIRPPEQNEEENAKEYEESQEQRRLERKLRYEKRDLEVLKAQGASDEEIKAQRLRVKNARTELNDFCEETGRARRVSRESTPIKAEWPDTPNTPTRPVTPGESVRQTATPVSPVQQTATPVEPVEVPKERTLNESLAEAYEYHRTANNLTSAPYDPDSGLKFITDDLSKLGEDSRKVTEKTISDLTSKYDTPLTSVRTMDKQETLLYRNTFASTGHNYSNDTAEITINPVKCADNAKLVERIRELRDKNYCAFVPDDALEKYVITHEFGHSLIAMNNAPSAKTNFVGVDIKKLTSVQEQVRSVFKEYREEVGRLEQARRSAELRFIRDLDEAAAQEARTLAQRISGIKISEYSLTDADEFFAESFTFTEYGGTGNAYANRIREIINQYFSR